MASFAELDENNTVLQVIAISNEIAPDNSAESEAAGQAFISDVLKLGGVWKQTSYNTYHHYEYEYDDSEPPRIISSTFIGSAHRLGGTPFRGTCAGIGYIYDAVTDTFLPPPTPEVNDETV